MTITIRPSLFIANGPIEHTEPETAQLQPLPAHPTDPNLPTGVSANAPPVSDGLDSVGALYGMHIALSLGSAGVLAQSARAPVPAQSPERTMRPIGSDPTDPGPSEPLPPPSPPVRR